MTDQYTMFDQVTSKDTTDATSSQELDYGTTHLTSHDGRKVCGFGPEVAHASRILQQVDKGVRETIGIYGPNGSGSSASVDLQLSLESRLRAQFPSGGLTMFIKGWKRKATESGRLYCRLAVSAHPIGGKDYGLWPTTQSRDYRTGMADRWWDKSRSNDLNDAVPALWSSPSTRDRKDTLGMAKKSVNKDGNKRNRYDQLGRQVFGSTAQTENKGSLSPEFPCWLMGIPNEWVSSIVRGMQLCRKSPPHSYKATWKRGE